MRGCQQRSGQQCAWSARCIATQIKCCLLLRGRGAAVNNPTAALVNYAAADVSQWQAICLKPHCFRREGGFMKKSCMGVKREHMRWSQVCRRPIHLCSVLWGGTQPAAARLGHTGTQDGKQLQRTRRRRPQPSASPPGRYSAGPRYFRLIPLIVCTVRPAFPQHA